MKRWFFIISLIIILIFCCGYSNTVKNIHVVTSYQPNVDKLESIFKTYLPQQKGIIFTKVPRGLIISVDERNLFNTGEARIKESSLCILDVISAVLKQIPNECVIEDHTEKNDLSHSLYNENWELSLARAGNIVTYLTLYKKIPSERIFALGYGEFMPFRDNVAPKNGLNNRIDFVILEYEAKR